MTDVTNASRTMMMNINTLDWDESLLEFFNLSASILPAIQVISQFLELSPCLLTVGFVL